MKKLLAVLLAALFTFGLATNAIAMTKEPIDINSTAYSRDYTSGVYSDEYGKRGYVVIHVVYEARSNPAKPVLSASYVDDYPANSRYRITSSMSYSETTRVLSVSLAFVDTEGSIPTLRSAINLKIANNGDLSLAK